MAQEVKLVLLRGGWAPSRGASRMTARPTTRQLSGRQARYRSCSTSSSSSSPAITCGITFSETDSIWVRTAASDRQRYTPSNTVLDDGS